MANEYTGHSRNYTYTEAEIHQKDTFVYVQILCRLPQGSGLDHKLKLSAGMESHA